MIFKKIVLTLLFLLSATVCLAIVPPQDNQQSIYVASGTVVVGNEFIFQAKTETVIYVSSESVIHGLFSVANTKTVPIPDAVVSSVISNDKNNVLGVSKEFVATVKVQDKTLKENQDKFNEEVAHTFYTSSDEQKSFTFERNDDHNAVTSSSSSSTTFTSALLVSSFDINTFIGQKAKQEFFNYFSFLQLRKKSAQFLRGPPLQMVQMI